MSYNLNVLQVTMAEHAEPASRRGEILSEKRTGVEAEAHQPAGAEKHPRNRIVTDPLGPYIHTLFTPRETPVCFGGAPHA